MAYLIEDIFESNETYCKKTPGSYPPFSEDCKCVGETVVSCTISGVYATLDFSNLTATKLSENFTLQRVIVFSNRSSDSNHNGMKNNEIKFSHLNWDSIKSFLEAFNDPDIYARTLRLKIDEMNFLRPEEFKDIPTMNSMERLYSVQLTSSFDQIKAERKLDFSKFNRINNIILKNLSHVTVDFGDPFEYTGSNRDFVFQLFHTKVKNNTLRYLIDNSTKEFSWGSSDFYPEFFQKTGPAWLTLNKGDDEKEGKEVIEGDKGIL